MTKPLFEHPGYEEFSKGFFEQHIEEMDFLFDQRAVFFADAQVPWPSVERLDGRIRAHAAALAGWGDGARAWARARLGGPETALPAAFTLATLGTEEDARASVDALNTVPPEILPRLVLGLSLARGPDSSPSLEALATSQSSDVRAAACGILGARRRGRTAVLQNLLHDGDPSVRAAAARALAALGFREIAPALERRISESPEEHGAFLWPLVELGSRAAAGACRLALSSGKAVSGDTLAALAIVGEPSDAALLRTAELSPRSAHALGVLGAAAAVPWLLSMLDSGHDGAAGETDPDEPLRAAAGAALARITGAGLQETTAVAQHSDEDAPRPASQRIERPSTDRALWDRWWRTNRARFDERTRYRGGAPLSVRASVEEVAAPLTPLSERRRAAAEIRHFTRTQTSFDPAGWIAEQKQAIRDWQLL